MVGAAVMDVTAGGFRSKGRSLNEKGCELRGSWAASIFTFAASRGGRTRQTLPQGGRPGAGRLPDAARLGTTLCFQALGVIKREK